MTISCPTCGSAVSADVTHCPSCGEALSPEMASAPQAVESTPAVPSPAKSASPRRRTATLICGECGAENSYGATACSVCGTSFVEEEAPVQRKRATPAATAVSSPTRDYMIFGIGSLILAGIVFLIAAPDPPKMSASDQPPPAQMPAAGAPNGAQLPPGHPPAGAPAGPTPEQTRKITELEAKLKASPDDLDTKLALANLYYDVNRDAEAVTLYQQYLKARPDDQSARTDMSVSMAQSGNVDGAIAELRRVIAANKDHQKASYNLAMMYFFKRDRDSTTYWLTRVRDIDPNSVQGREAQEILSELSGAHPSHEGEQGHVIPDSARIPASGAPASK